MFRIGEGHQMRISKLKNASNHNIFICYIFFNEGIFSDRILFEYEYKFLDSYYLNIMLESMKYLKMKSTQQKHFNITYSTWRDLYTENEEDIFELVKRPDSFC